jgi:hypothetical protein
MDWAAHIRRILVHLGEDVTVTGTSGTADVRGLFLNSYQTLNFDGAVAIASASPRFVGMTADLPSGATAIITARGTHGIKNREPDDPGGYTVLELFKS